MARVITFCMQKGGTGKTTSTLNVGACLSRMKKKVLMVDLDPQANLTVAVLGIPGKQGRTAYEVLKDGVAPQDTIISKNEMDIIPSFLGMAAIEMELATRPDRELLLKRALKKLPDYDYVMVDTPPNLGPLTLNGLVAAQLVMVPVEMEFFALHGLAELCKTLELVKEMLNPGLEMRVFATKYNVRRKMTKEVWEEIREAFPDELLSSYIRDNVSLIEAPANQKDIFRYRKHSYGAKDYLAISKEILALKDGRKKT